MAVLTNATEFGIPGNSHLHADLPPGCGGAGRIRGAGANCLPASGGFSGARLTGSPSWMRNNLRAQSFREYEYKLDGQLTREQMIAACTFPLRLTGAKDILDAARTHQFAVTVRKGVW